MGFLSEDDKGLGWRIGLGPPLWGPLESRRGVVEKHGIDKIVVAVEDRRKQLPLQALLELRLRGTEILEEARLHEETAGKIPVEDLRPSWLIFSEGFSNTPMRNVTKRIFDIVVAAVCLVLSAPLALAVALAVRLDSKGPILFKQHRVGQRGWEFTLYKFRSMRTDAEASGQPQWAQKNDPRVTRVGRILRRTRPRRDPADVERAPGFHELRRTAARAPLLRRGSAQSHPVLRSAARLETGHYGLGTGTLPLRLGRLRRRGKAAARHVLHQAPLHLFDLRILLETIKVVLRGELGR